MYNIKDYYLPEYGPTANQEEGLKLRSQDHQPRRSPRSAAMAPPNRPVKEYLLDQEATLDSKPTHYSSNNFFTTVAHQSPLSGTATEFPNAIRKGKYPKPEVRLQLTPYPPLPKSKSIKIQNKPRQIEKILNNDRKWHKENGMRLAVSVKQGVIPELRHFTHQYDNAMVNQFNIKKRILENQDHFEIEEFQQNGAVFKRVNLKEHNMVGEQPAEALKQRREKDKESRNAVFLTDLISKADNINSGIEPVNYSRGHHTVEIAEEDTVSENNENNENLDDVSMNLDVLQNQLDNFSQNIEQLKKQTQNMTADATNRVRVRSKLPERVRYDPSKEAVSTAYYSIPLARRGKSSQIAQWSNENAHRRDCQEDTTRARIKTAKLRQRSTLNPAMRVKRGAQSRENEQIARKASAASRPETVKSRRVLSLTLQNSNMNFKEMKIQDVVNQQKHILDQKEQMMLSTLSPQNDKVGNVKNKGSKQPKSVTVINRHLRILGMDCQVGPSTAALSVVNGESIGRKNEPHVGNSLPSMIEGLQLGLQATNQSFVSKGQEEMHQSMQEIINDIETQKRCPSFEREDSGQGDERQTAGTPETRALGTNRSQAGAAINFSDIDEINKQENLNRLQRNKHHSIVPFETAQQVTIATLQPPSEPTFYERSAFKDDFLRKWKVDHGRVSIFDKRQQYKSANSRAKSATDHGSRNARRGKFATAKQPFIGIQGSQANITYMDRTNPANMKTGKQQQTCTPVLFSQVSLAAGLSAAGTNLNEFAVGETSMLNASSPQLVKDFVIVDNQIFALGSQRSNESGQDTAVMPSKGLGESDRFQQTLRLQKNPPKGLTGPQGRAFSGHPNKTRARKASGLTTHKRGQSGKRFGLNTGFARRQPKIIAQPRTHASLATLGTAKIPPQLLHNQDILVMDQIK